MTSSLSRSTLLVVEDDDLVATFMERGLRTRIDVTVAPGGLEALRRLANGERFDLVLSDLHMHDISGIELYRRARELDPRLADRFAFMTGGSIEPDSLAALAALSTGCLDKPFTLAQLREFLRSRGLDT